MAVIKPAARLWPRTIPYTIASEPRPGFVAEQVAAFNAAIRKELFVPRRAEPDYVEFAVGAEHSSCVIGQQLGKQKLAFRPENIVHEMGHCVGLGHEHLHTKWPGASILSDPRNDSIHALAYRMQVNQHIDFGPFDAGSIMLYDPEKLGIPAVQYGQLAGHDFVKNTKLSQGDVFALRNLSAHVPDGVPQLAGAGAAGTRIGANKLGIESTWRPKFH